MNQEEIKTLRATLDNMNDYEKMEIGIAPIGTVNYLNKIMYGENGYQQRVSKQAETIAQQAEQIAGLVATNATLDAEWKKTTADKFAEMESAIRVKDAALKEQNKQLRIEADFNFEQYQDAGRLMFELKEIAEQQAEAIRLKDAALIAVRDDLELRMQIAEDESLNISNSVLDQMCDAIDLQPSPDILQARVEKVQRQAYERAAEVCEHFAENGVCHTNYPEEAFAGDCAVAIRALIKGDGK